IGRTTAQRFAHTTIARQDVEAAGVPLLAGLERDLEADSSVGERCRARVLQQAKDEAAREVAIRVRGLQLPAGLVPIGRNTAAAHKSTGLDFEEIGEVRAQRNLEIEANGGTTVVRDVDVLMDAVSHAADERQPERASADRSVFCLERRIRQLESS